MPIPSLENPAINKYIKLSGQLAILAAGNAHAADSQKPRLEYGVAGAGIQTAAYPSSSIDIQRQFFAPWFIYRSDKVQVKDGGVKLIAYQSDKITIDLGIGGSLSADTSETPLRDGMPDIDYLLELGPRFDVPLRDSSDAYWRNRINWVSSYRFALSTDFKRLDFRGPVLTTELLYRKDGIKNSNLSFDLSVSSTWLGDPLMDYFFAVNEQYATDERPQFNAQSGFLGIEVSAGVQFRPVSKLNTYIGVGFTSLDGSKNRNSPLFESKSNARIILAASWKLYASEDLVTVSDE